MILKILWMVSKAKLILTYIFLDGKYVI